MKLSRRHAIGTLVGGLTAGPSVAEAAIKSGLDGPACAPMSLSGAQEAKVIDHRSWLFDRKAELERTIRGEFDEREEYPVGYRPSGDWGLDHIDCLRSVSMANKRRMASDFAMKRARQNRIGFAERQLKDILKRLGLT